MSDMKLGITIDLSGKEAIKFLRELGDDVKALRKAFQTYNAEQKKAADQGRKTTEATEKQSVANKRLERDLKKVRSGLGHVVNQQKKTVAETRATTKAIERQSAALKRTESAARSTSSSFSGLGTVLTGLGLGYATKQMISLNMSMEATQKTLNYVAGSAEGGAKMFAYVTEQADRLGLQFNTLVNSYAQISAATKDTGIEGAITKEIFLSAAEAATVLGMSADDLGGTMKAFIQMLSKGNVQAEELRGQLGERLVGAFDAAAKAAGKTRAEMNKALDLGDVEAEDLLPKLAEQLRTQFAPALEEATKTARAEWNRLINELTYAQTDLGSNGFMAGFTQGVVDLRKELKGMREDGTIAALGKSMGEIITFAVQNADHIASLVKAYAAYKVSVTAATLATNLFTGALMRNPWVGAAVAIGGLVFTFSEMSSTAAEAAGTARDMAAAIDEVTIASEKSRITDLKKEMDRKQSELAVLYAKYGQDQKGGMISILTTDIGRLYDQILLAEQGLKDLEAAAKKVDEAPKPKPSDKPDGLSDKALEKLRKEYQALAMAIDPVYAKQVKLTEGTEILWQAYQAGMITGSDYEEMFVRLQASLDTTTKKTKKLTEAEERLKSIRESYAKGQYDNLSGALLSALDDGLDAGVKKFWKSWADLGKKTIADTLAYTIQTGEVPKDLGPIGSAFFGGEDAPLLKEFKDLSRDLISGIDDIGGALGFGTKDKDGNLIDGKLVSDTLSKSIGDAFASAGFGASVGGMIPGGSATGGAAGAMIGEAIGGPLGKLAGAIIGSVVVGAFKKTKTTSVDLSGGNVVQLSDYYAKGGANQNASSSMAGAAAAALDQLMYLSGGALSGSIGSLGVRKDKPFFDPTGGNGKSKRNRQTFGSAEEAIFAAIEHALVSNASGMGQTFQTIRANSRATTAEGLLSDFQFGRAYNDLLASDPGMTQMEQQIRQLKQQFNDAALKARQLGLSEQKLGAVRQKILDHMKAEFDSSIEIQLLQFTDPFQAAIKQQVRDQEKLLREAYAVGADLDQVYALIDAQRKDLITSFEEETTSALRSLSLSVDDFKQSLLGGSASRFSRDETFGSASQYFATTLAAANDNDTDALNRIVKAAEDKINAAFELFGSSAEAFKIQAETLAALDALKTAPGITGTVPDLAATLAANPAPTLTADLMKQVDDNITLSNDILSSIDDTLKDIYDAIKGPGNGTGYSGGGGGDSSGGDLKGQFLSRGAA